jgi:hypothetical protein
MRRVAMLCVCVVAIANAACKRPQDAEAPPVPAQAPASASAAAGVAFVCPMDRDIRSNVPGNCPRCGMALVAGIPEPTEYHLDLSVAPQPPRPNEKIRLTFEVFDPWKNLRVEKFSIVHEKLFHAFIVSRDLNFFVHDHPVWRDGSFQYDIALPRPGMYRILGDFYPEAATPQLITKTVFVAGTEAAVKPLTRDYSAKQAENLRIELATSPVEPIAGLTTQMRFSVTPTDGLEKYLGAWAHLLAASQDLIDMIHTHPSIADGSPQMQFNIIFPRAGAYRLWVQFQRNGVVNTASFDVPVKPSDSSTLISN